MIAIACCTPRDFIAWPVSPKSCAQLFSPGYNAGPPCARIYGRRRKRIRIGYIEPGWGLRGMRHSWLSGDQFEILPQPHRAAIKTTLYRALRILSRMPLTYKGMHQMARAHAS